MFWSITSVPFPLAIRLISKLFKATCSKLVPFFPIVKATLITHLYHFERLFF